MLAKRPPLPK